MAMKLTSFMAMLETALASKTVYLWGCFGHPVGQTIIDQKAVQYPTWYTPERIAYFEGLIGQGYYAFDCVNMIKGILWGWSKNPGSFTGGAAYGTMGVPDTNANGFFNLCTDKTTDFSGIIPGAIVWTDGHVGVYRGNREVIETTYRWSDGVQVTGIRNLGDYRTKSRTWKQWGKSPFIDYTSTVPTPPPEEPEVEDETPVPDNHVLPGDEPDYSIEYEKSYNAENGFQPLGADALYTIDAADFSGVALPTFDENGFPIPDGAICEVRIGTPPQYFDLWRKAFGAWWRYSSTADYSDFAAFPPSPVDPAIYPVQIIAFDWFTNEVKLFALREELYRRTVFADNKFSLTGVDTDTISGVYCVLEGGAWRLPVLTGAPGWTVAEIYACTRNVWIDKVKSVVLFGRNI